MINVSSFDKSTSIEEGAIKNNKEKVRGDGGHQRHELFFKRAPRGPYAAFRTYFMLMVGEDAR